jgi:hypothetical protein
MDSDINFHLWLIKGFSICFYQTSRYINTLNYKNMAVLGILTWISPLKGIERRIYIIKYLPYRLCDFLSPFLGHGEDLCCVPSVCASTMLVSKATTAGLVTGIPVTESPLFFTV